MRACYKEKDGLKMDIKSYIKKLFKIQNLNMVSLNDTLYVPTRDDINKKSLPALEEIKNEYLIILKDKIFASYNLGSMDYRNEMIKLFYLFNRTILNQEEVYNFSTMPNYEKRELFLNYLINPYKILIYVRKMTEIYDKTQLMLVALNEILNENELDENIVSVIRNEIDILKTNLVIFKKYLLIAIKEVSSNRNNLSSNRDLIKYGRKVNNNELKKYYREIKGYAKLLVPDKLKDIFKSNKPLKEKIANIEIELEGYCYDNLKIDDLNNELVMLDRTIKSEENKQELLNQINDLELKYLVLNRYGGYELDLSALYQVKFDILTTGLIDEEDSPFMNIGRFSERELAYYKDIILNLISINITGLDSVLNNTSDIDDKFLIDTIFVLVRGNQNDNDEYGTIDILKDKFKLCLLLNIPYPEKVLELFDKTIVPIYDHNYHAYTIFSFYGITLDNDIPLSTLCRIMSFYNSCEDMRFKFSIYDRNWQLANVYSYYASLVKDNSDVFCVPNGINKLAISASSGKDSITLYKNIAEMVNHKTIVMPNCLREFYVNTAAITFNIPKIVFNEGLEVLDCKLPLLYTFNGLKSITIPSAVSLLYFFDQRYNFDNNSLNSFEEIIFTNIEDSILLH